MKKRLIARFSVALMLSMFLTGCQGNSNESQTGQTVRTSEGQEASEESSITRLNVRFGDDGETFVMNLEDNETAAAVARYVGSNEWRLPIYNYDESEVMQYYDVPSRYEIPDHSEPVTHAQAGDVYYSDPNRIVLYYHDADISEQYTKIGTFDATDEFVSSVEENPVLEGWGNKIVIISVGE